MKYSTLISINLSVNNPEISYTIDHLLRKVDKLLDLDFLYDLTEELYCMDNGRASINPVLFFRMQLISYLFGIESDRQLCRDIHLNLAYRWFCRLPLCQSVPHHSSLTRIRDRMGESRYQQIFKLMLLQWQKQGRFTGKQIVADATLVKANAAMGSLVKREDADPDARVLKQYEKQYHDFQHGKRKRRVANQTHVSASDPDATMVYRKGTEGGLKYKVHYSADVKTSRIDYLCDEMGFDVQEVIVLIVDMAGDQLTVHLGNARYALYIAARCWPW